MKNPVSFISNFLSLRFQLNGDFIRRDDGSVYITNATGFLYRKNDDYYLITNLHVISGRNIFTQQPLDQNGALPTQINFIPSVINNAGCISKKINFELISPLYDDQNTPFWLVHPQFKRTVDVAVLPIKLIKTPLRADERFFCITDVFLDDDLIFEVADDVFVVGYPFGRGSVFTDVLPIPVWKRASIASEMDLNYYMDDRPVFLVDTMTKPGMSGSPVIGMAKGLMRGINGSVSIGTGYAMKFLGIYSGRIDGEQQGESCLGLVWKKELIDEIIDGRTRDEPYYI